MEFDFCSNLGNNAERWLNMRFLNKKLNAIYKYLYIHDGDIYCQSEIAKDLGFTRTTVRKYVKYLIRREYIKKDGRRIHILPQ